MAHRVMEDSLQGLLVESAGRCPQNIAVIEKGNKITYAELNFSSGAFCSALIGKGVTAAGRVGILMDKSIDAIIAIFAILKSGAAYLPLDPSSPVLRQVNVINNSGLEHLVIGAKNLPVAYSLLEAGCNLKHVFVIDMHRDEHKGQEKSEFVFKEEIFAQKETTREKREGAQQLAYILYTSGSRGHPKGVMISHKAALAFVNWAHKYFSINNGDRFVSVSPFCFDLSIFDIFVSVKAGAVLYLPPAGMFAFPRTASGFIKENKITTLYSVPYVLIQLILYGAVNRQEHSSLKRVIFAGDVFPPQYLRRLMQTLPECLYYNLYGPTETNVCTAYPVKNISEEEASLPIGKPCDGTEIIIVDEKGKICHNSEIGEICVKGPTVMDGYLGDREQAGNAFIRDLAAKGLSGKIYKTGDLGSVDSEGNLRFHGRKDRLIKSRGYRIELDEVEAAVRKHPAVKEAVVWAVPDTESGNRIKAAILPQHKNGLCEEEVRRFCRQSLPDYMIPEAVVFTDAMPKTATDKIDRVAVENTYA